MREVDNKKGEKC